MLIKLKKSIVYLRKKSDGMHGTLNPMFSETLG